jgi:hypothetical protein
MNRSIIISSGQGISQNLINHLASRGISVIIDQTTSVTGTIDYELPDLSNCVWTNAPVCVNYVPEKKLSYQAEQKALKKKFGAFRKRK